jgi:trimeric autotransporter adhesin
VFSSPLSDLAVAGSIPRERKITSINPLIQLKTTPPLLITLALLYFGLSPTAKALLPEPPPDGGYPGANTAEGTDALFSLTSGIANTAVGQNALHDNTTGGFNVAIGSSALANNTTGSFNMAVGTDALRDNNANFNLAIGFRVLFMNTTGNHLTGIGAAALRNNTTASDNTAIGADALRENTTGENNTAIGADALAQNTSAEQNTAIGASALANNNGSFNTAVGYLALLNKTTGGGNTAVGLGALSNITSGENNIAVGQSAGGGNAGGGSNNIYIGNGGSLDSDTIRIGIQGTQTRTFLAGISGTAIVSGAPVAVDGNGQLGVALSSRRFKKEIDPMNRASEAILALEPVTFHYKNDKTSTPQFGLIAEGVAKVNPDLVLRDKEGKPYTRAL